MGELNNDSRIPAERILEIAGSNTRYELSGDRRMIRNLHRHSVDMEYEDVVEPPDVLYLDTSLENLGPMIKPKL